MVEVKVFHNIFGEGYIQSVDEAVGTVSVIFSLGTQTERQHTFPYPSVFEKHLKYDDTGLQAEAVVKINEIKFLEQAPIKDIVLKYIQDFRNASNDDDIIKIFNSIFNTIIYIDVDDEIKQDNDLYIAVLKFFDDMYDVINNDKDRFFVKAFRNIYNGDYDGYFNTLGQYFNVVKDEDITYDGVYVDFLNVLNILSGDDNILDANLNRLSGLLNEYKEGTAFCDYMNFITKPKQNTGDKIKVLELILEKDKNWYAVYKHLGDIYYFQKDWVKAIENYGKVLSSGKLWQTAEVYFFVGYACSKINQHARAIDYYKKCLSLSPDYVYANNNIGWGYYRVNDYELALRHFDKSIELGTDKYYPFRNKLKTLVKLGRNEEAITLAKENPAYFKVKHCVELLDKISKGQDVDKLLDGTEDVPS